MKTTLRKVLGDKIADRCQDVWDLDEEGEVNAVSFNLCGSDAFADFCLLDLAALWAPQALVFWWKFGVGKNLFEVIGFTDQGFA